MKKKLLVFVMTLAMALAMVPVISNAETTEPNYLTFTAQQDGSSVSFKYFSGSAQYSTDGGTTWVDCKPAQNSEESDGDTFSLDNGESVQLRGTNVITYDVSKGTSYHFSMSGKIAASGSVTSLTDGNGGDENVVLQECCYASLFRDCTALTTAPALPAKELAKGCYWNMFKGCNNLVKAPALPASTLKEMCYTSMFAYCTSLMHAPELKATTLANECYQNMFEGCWRVAVTESTEADCTIAIPETSATNAKLNMFDNFCRNGDVASTPDTGYYRTYPAVFVDSGEELDDYEVGEYCFATVQAAIDFASDYGNSKEDAYTVILNSNMCEDISIATDKYVNLDLNGFVLKGTGNVSVITNNGTLSIKDSNEGNQTHYFTVGSDGLWNWNDDNYAEATSLDSLTFIPAMDDIIAVSGGCITGSINGDGAVDNKGDLTLSNGNIIGNKGSNAAGIHNNKDKSFSMTGGCIAGNINDDGSGGVRNSGQFNFSNGTIAYNTVTVNGGVAGVYNDENGELSMTGGSIMYNQAMKDVFCYAGVSNSGSINMTGGSIRDNIAGNNNFAGIVNGGDMTLGGNAKIVDNTLANGESSNCCVMINVGEEEESYKDYLLSIATGTNAPSGEMKVGVTVLDAQEYSSAEGQFTTNGSESDKDFFTSDDNDYNVAYNSDKKCLELVEKPAVCKIGDKEYPSIKKALKKSEGNIDEEANTPTVITMIANDEENVTIPKERNIELDLNGYVLKALDTGDSVITVDWLLLPAKLTITDSNSEKVHYFRYKTDGPWEYIGDAAPTDEGVNVAASIDKITKDTTHVMLKGGCITGGNAQGEDNGGGAIYNCGNLTVKGTNIVGNSGNLGGAIYCAEDLCLSKMILNGVNIVGNTAEKGGGVYSGYDAQNLFYGCTIANNRAETGGGIYKQDNAEDMFVLIDTEVTANYASTDAGGIFYKEAQTGCVAEGTMLRMADGSEKPIEEIKEGELVRSFDHESGEVSSASVYLVFKGQDEQHPLKLNFEDGLSIDIVGAHSFLEKESCKYVCIMEENVQSYVGKSFYGEDGKWHKLIGAKKASNSCKYYSIFTSNHHNCYANGLLNASDVMSRVNPFLNIYELDTSLKADTDQLAKDIEEYGLTDYEEINSKYGISRKLFDNANGKYLNIALGKGLITEEQLEHLCSFANQYENNNVSKTKNFAPVKAILKSLGICATPSLDDYSSNKDILTLGKNVVITDNYVCDPDTGNLTRSNVYITDSKKIIIDDDFDNSKVGVTLSTGTGAFTTNGTKSDLKYFFSDNTEYAVSHVEASTDPEVAEHLELVDTPTLYFGMYGGDDNTRQYECSIYTDKERTQVYTEGAGTWSVEFIQDKGMQLNLDNFSTDRAVQICKETYINVKGTNTIGNGLVVNEGCNVNFVGDGTLKIESEDRDAMKINSKVTIEGSSVICESENKKDVIIGENGKVLLAGGTICDNEITYPGDTLYLMKPTDKDYALYADEAGKYEYIAGKDTDWAVSEEEVEDVSYAALQLSGTLDKKVVFKQSEDKSYIAVLRVNGTDAKLGEFDVSEGTLTVQSSSGNKITVSGDITAQKLYMASCDGLTMNIVNGSLIAAEKEGTANELMINSTSNEDMVKLDIKNGGILFEKGTISFENANITIAKKDTKAAEVGINGHSIILDASALNISDVKTGIKLYDSAAGDDDGGVISLNNDSTLNIDVANVGVQGTVGRNYYNNISVLDDDSTITVKGGDKAVASAAIEAIPSGKLVRSTDDKLVVFTINDDADCTTDYYYAGTTTVAKGLTLADITVKIANNIEHGSVAINDPGAGSGKAVTITVTPDEGYELDKITVADKNGKDITDEVLNGTTITMPAADKMPITVSASFKEKATPTPTPTPTPVTTYTVKFDAQGHGTAPADQTIAAGGKVKEPEALAEDGYVFGGWFKEAECVEAWDFDKDTVAKNTTLYAKWTVKEEPKPAEAKTVFLARGTAKKTSIVYKWNKVDGAAKYKIYIAKCGQKKYKSVKTTTALTFTKKSLKKKTAYKAYIVAYDKNGKKIANTPTIHIMTTGGKYSNATKVSAKELILVNAGESAKLEAKIAKKDSKKKMLCDKHVSAAIRYYSADKSIATVDAKGNVTGVSAGTVNIYAVAPSGAYAVTKIVVE